MWLLENFQPRVTLYGADAALPKPVQGSDCRANEQMDGYSGLTAIAFALESHDPGTHDHPVEIQAP